MITNPFPRAQPPTITLVLGAAVVSLGIREQCSCSREAQKLEKSGLGKGMNCGGNTSSGERGGIVIVLEKIF